MKKKFLLIVICLLIKATILSAQQYIYKQFTTKDGLPSSEVYHVLQDSKGYIWFATDNGVSRYNGYEFENFDVNDGLPYNSISEIYEDYKGRIWFVGMNRTLSYYINGKINEYKYNLKLISLFKTQRTPIKSSFFVDSLDNIYISYRGTGIYSIDLTGKIYSLDKSDKSISIYNQFEQKLLANFIGVNELITLKLFNNDTSNIFSVNFSCSVPASHIFSFQLKNKNLLISINRTIFELKDDKIYEKKQFNNYIQYLHIDDESKIWVCYRNGGADCYLNQKLEESSKISFFENENLSSVANDNNGGIWFTTLNKGVYYISTKKNKHISTIDGLVSNNITCLAFDENNIWVGYNLSAINKISNRLKVTDKINLNSDEAVQALFRDTSKNKLYIGTSDWIYSIEKNDRIKIIKNNHPKINISATGPGRFNTNRFVKSNDFLWTCGSSGFQCLYKDNVIFDSWLDKGLFMRINGLCFADSVIWVGSEKGLGKYYNDTIVFLGEKNELLKTRILDIIKIYGTLILATKGSGILFYDNQNVKKIYKADGLGNNTITALCLTDTILWSGGGNGLNKTILRIENNKLKIGPTTQIPQLSKYEIRQIINKNNILYLATNDGLVVYDLKLENNKIVSIPIYITSLKVNNTKLSQHDSYKLENTQNNLTINFEALFYKDPQSIQYRYKLIGLDKDWIYTSNREARYYYLPPGKYTFMVEAHNHSGEKSENQAMITFEIIHAIWQTTYFKIGIGIFLLTVLIMLYKVKVVSTKQKASLKKNMYTYMMQALVGQMNPHFIFNTLNSINNYILANDKRAASTYLVRFSKLIRRILNNSRQMYVTLEEEIEAIKLYLEIEALRIKNKFEYTIEFSEEIEPSKLKIPSMLIQPYIENSIWHGIQPSDKHGIIRITIKKNVEYLVIDIIDNGVGRKNSNKKKPAKENSLGTKITASRFDLLEKTLNKKAKVEYSDLNDNSGSTGTKVTITLPVIQ